MPQKASYMLSILSTLVIFVDRHSVQESRAREEGLRREIQELQEKLKTEVKALQHKLNDTEERLKGW